MTTLGLHEPGHGNLHEPVSDATPTLCSQQPFSPRPTLERISLMAPVMAALHITPEAVKTPRVETARAIKPYSRWPKHNKEAPMVTIAARVDVTVMPPLSSQPPGSDRVDDMTVSPLVAETEEQPVRQDDDLNIVTEAERVDVTVASPLPSQPRGSERVDDMTVSLPVAETEEGVVGDGQAPGSPTTSQAPPASPKTIFIGRATRPVEINLPVPPAPKRRKRTMPDDFKPRRSRRVAKLSPEADHQAAASVCRQLGFTSGNDKVSIDSLDQYARVCD